MIPNNIEVMGISGLIDSIDNIFSEINDILWIYDAEKNILRVSKNINEVCSCDYRSSINNVEDFIGIVYSRDQKKLYSSLLALTQGKINNLSMEIRIVCPDNSVKYFIIKGRRIEVKNDEDNIKILLSGNLIDIDERKINENKLNHMAYFDLITGLPNRSMFVYKTSITINRRRIDFQKCAVVNLDLDNFKRINDIYGHYLGDDLLRAVSIIISNVLEKQEMLARFNGDGFLVLLPKVNGYDEVEMRVKKILGAINRNISINGIDINLTCSAGIAVYPSDGNTAEELIKNADAAMYKAKEEGRNKTLFFEKSINIAIQKKIEMEKHLRSALENNEFYMVYQPQVDILTGNIAGVEALIRWESPVYGNVSPIEFIPVIEDTELIFPLGVWILETACMHNKKWLDEKNIRIPVSVNVSPIQLKDGSFETVINDIIYKTGLPLELLKLEITESAFMENFQTSFNILERLRMKGVKIALDDFGTGYSSLNYLKSLPLNTLKIDKSFIDGLTENTKEKAIIGSIIDMAHFLNLDVVAEGVETKEQYECLKYFGCNLVQGFYFSRPLRVESFEKIWF